MYTIIHAIIGYFFLLLTVRVLSRRPGAQMTLYEFVIVFLIGSVIILATVGDDRSVTNCVCAVITVGLMHGLLSWAKAHSPRLGPSSMAPRSSFSKRSVAGRHHAENAGGPK